MNTELFVDTFIDDEEYEDPFVVREYCAECHLEPCVCAETARWAEELKAGNGAKAPIEPDTPNPTHVSGMPEFEAPIEDPFAPRAENSAPEPGGAGSEVTQPEPVKREPVTHELPPEPVQARPMAGRGVGAIRNWVFEVQRAFPKNSRVCLFAALYGYHAHLGTLVCDVSVTDLTKEAGFNRTRMSGLQDELIRSGYLIYVRAKGPAKVCQLAVPDIPDEDGLPW
jgi:hypothetical protein